MGRYLFAAHGLLLLLAAAHLQHELVEQALALAHLVHAAEALVLAVLGRKL